jgi:hypothetical protein
MKNRDFRWPFHNTLAQADHEIFVLAVAPET